MHGDKHQRDVARAIRRSRKARAAIRARRRRTALVGVLAVALAGAGTFFVTGVTGSDLAHAAVSQAKSLTDLLDARSPGERTEEQLTKTKRARALAKHRVGPAAVHRQPSKQMVELAQLLTSQPLAPVSLEQPLPLSAISSPTPLQTIIGGGVGGGGGGGVMPPGGGGGGPVTFPTTQPRQVITGPSAVPEPGTWATMLLGFGFIGWRMRRRARRPIGQPA